MKRTNLKNYTLNTLTVLIVLFAAINLNAQKRFYFDESGNKAKSSNAVFYKDITKSGDKYKVKEYYSSNNKLKLQGSYTTSSTRDEDRHGRFSAFYENGQMEYEVRLTVKRFDQHIISLEYYVSLFCGGAYPDSYTQGYTFNRKTGEQITLSRLFNLADEETSNDSLNKLAIQANEAIIRSMVKETLKNDGSSLCDYDNYPLFGEKNFYIDKTNIHFLPDFPRALAACRDSKLSHVRLSKVKTLMDASLQPLFLE